MAQAEIRTARPEDRDTILAFCERIWDHPDYIEQVWDDWLTNSNGYLVVATLDGKPVGMAHLRMLSQTEAWLEGMRVDPDYRQLGIASALNKAMLEEAMRRDAVTARLVTESINNGAMRLIEKDYMRRIASFVTFTASTVTAPPKRSYGLETPTVATSADLDEIINYLNGSNIFPVVGGLYYHGYTGFAITQPLLESKIAAQHVYILRRWERLDGLVIAAPRVRGEEQRLFIGYIDGTTESISLLAYAMRRKAAELHQEKVIATIPDLMMVRDAFIGAEYEWNGSVWYTYERSLV